MAWNENKAVSTSFALQSTLFLIFLIMKLTGAGSVADWSWWWVTSPLWIPTAFALCIILIIGVAFVLGAAWAMIVVVAEWIKDLMKQS